MRPVKLSRNVGSNVESVVAILSVRVKRDGGVFVEARRLSRTWEPEGERASVSVGLGLLGCEDGEGGGGKRRALISFRRKGVFVGLGWSADCRMCVVV